LLSDFAKHDASIDLLHVLHTKDLAENDNLELVRQLNMERNQLKNFELITEETINGAVFTDRYGKIQWVNKAFEKITGYTLAEAVGKSPGSLLQGKDSDPATIAYLKQQILAGLHFECEILNYHKSGTPYWVKIHGQPIMDETGAVVRYFALEEDITQHKLTEASLEKQRIFTKKY